MRIHPRRESTQQKTLGAGGVIRKALAAPTKKTKAKQVAAPVTKEVKPDEVIPMDDADFKDF